MTEASLQQYVSGRGTGFDMSTPHSVHLLLNDKCNARCIFCGGDYYHSRSGRMLTFEKVKVISKNIHLERFQQVVLAGAGDPLLCPDFVPIMQYLRAEFPAVEIAVTTNGIGLNRSVSEAVLDNRVAMLNISLNAGTRETYCRLMQVDAFDLICRQVREFAQLCWNQGTGPRLQLSIPIMRCNVEELPLLVRFASEVGAVGVNVFYCRFYPREIRNDKDGGLLPDAESLFFHQELSDRIVEEAVSLGRQLGVRVDHEPLFRHGEQPRCCKWTEDELMIGFDGEVFPCGGGELHFKKKLENGTYDFGNALKQPIEQFWNNESYRAIRVSSNRDSRCTVPECLECANMTSHMEQRGHIMEWADFSAKSLQKSVPVAVSPPLVSVIVPTHNRPEMLKNAIRSILDQTFQDFEVIVVNDAGDDVSSVVQSFNSTKLRYLSHDTNKGLAAARNTGIRAAKGKYIAYLDDDDVFYPEHLEMLLGSLGKDGAKVVYSDAYRAHQRFEDGRYVTYYLDIPYSYDFDADRILYENYVPVLCFIHEKSCFELSGYFDESLSRLEDWDLWIRMSRHFIMRHISVVTCEFRYRPDGSSMVSGSLPMFLSMTERIFKKYAPLIRGRAEIYGRFLSHLFSLQYNVEMLLESEIAKTSGFDFDPPEMSQLFKTLLSQGATREQILSAWYTLKAGFESAPPERESCLKLALELNPANSSARCNLIGLLAGMGRNDDIANHINTLLASNPLDRTLQSLAVSLYRAGFIPAPKLDEPIPRCIKLAVFSNSRPADASRYYGIRRGCTGEIEILWGTCRLEDGRLSIMYNMAEEADLLLISGALSSEDNEPALKALLSMGKPVIYDAVGSLGIECICAADASMLVQVMQASLVLVPDQSMVTEYSRYNRNVVPLSDAAPSAVWREICRNLVQ